MNMEYKAMYGYGYHLTSDNLAKMDEEKYEELMESDFIYIVNNWADGDDYFFGLIVTEAKEGDIKEIPLMEYEHTKFMKMMNEYRSFFPNASPIPKHYLIYQVY